MQTLYAFLAGPGLVCSVLAFTCGMLFRVGLYVRGLDWRADRVAYRPACGRGVRGAFVSIATWLVPFAPRSARARPYAAMACWCFHTGLIVVALLLPGHEAMRRQAFGFSLSLGLPVPLADALTALALCGLLLLAARRVCVPAVRVLSTRREWAALLVCAALLASGVLARLHGGPAELSPWLLVHMACGELFLLCAPFTRFAHMVLFFCMRAQLGMDYAIKRGGAKRGAAFPW